MCMTGPAIRWRRWRYPEHGEALLLWAPFSVLLLLLYWSVTALHYSYCSVSADRACSTYWGVQWHWHWVYHALVKLSERGLHAPAGWYPCQLESCEAPRTR